MKQLKTKVIMSAFVLLFALVATIGSTYAWFTVSNEVAVQSIDLDIITADSLLIQVQDDSGDSEAVGLPLSNTVYSNATTGYFPNGLDDFQSTITIADIADTTQYSDYTDYLMTNLTVLSTPTSGAGFTDYTLLDLTALSSIDLDDTSRLLTPESENGTTTVDAGYIEFNFWLIYSGESASVDVALQDLAVTVTYGAAALADALAFGTIGDNTATKNVFSLDPDYAFAFGQTDAGYLGSGATPSVYDSVDATLSTLLGQHSLWFDSDGVEDVTYISSDSISAADSPASTVCTLTPNTPELLTFRIWIEGWDVDATNALSAADFTVSFGFIIKTA